MGLIVVSDMRPQGNSCLATLGFVTESLWDSHLRRDVWTEHFAWEGARLTGRTAVGRATIQTLRLNRVDAVSVRQLLMREGVYPVD